MDTKKPKDSHFPSVFVVVEEGLARQSGGASRWATQPSSTQAEWFVRIGLAGPVSPALGPFSKGLTHFHGCWHVLGLLFFGVLCSCRGCKPAVLCSQGLERHVHPIKRPHGVPSFVIQVDMGSSFFKTPQRGNNFPLVLPLTYRKGGTTKIWMYHRNRTHIEGMEMVSKLSA